MDGKLGHTKSKFRHDTFQISVHIHGYIIIIIIGNLWRPIS